MVGVRFEEKELGRWAGGGFGGETCCRLLLFFFLLVGWPRGDD